MNTTSPKAWTLGVYAIAIIGTFFLMAWLVSFVRQYTQPPPLNQARAEERQKAWTELQAANAAALNNYGWVDQGNGLVQLPIKTAMQLTVREWQKPALARSNLVALAEKAAASPPAPAPAQGAKP